MASSQCRVAFFFCLLAVGALSGEATSRNTPPDEHDDGVPLANIQRARSQAQDEISQFASMLGSLFGSLGSFSPLAGDPADPPAAKTVAELLDHSPGNVSILTNGVKRAEVQTILADPNFTATIFAPTNVAFEAALLKLKLTPVQLYADKTALVNILSYHVVPNNAYAAADLKDGSTLHTVNDKDLKVLVDKVKGVSIQGASETAKVVAADIWAGKAVIHVVDTVLIPPQPPSVSAM